MTCDKQTPPQQTITTAVNHPFPTGIAVWSGDPWTVTTIRLPDESEAAMVRRHAELVRAVREAKP